MAYRENPKKVDYLLYFDEYHPIAVVKAKDNNHAASDGMQQAITYVQMPDLSFAYSSNSDPCWFGFPLTSREGIKREIAVRRIEAAGVQTRMLFAGNPIRPLCFDQMREEKSGYRIASGLDNTDRIMRNTFWVGLYPRMSEEKLSRMA